MADSTIKINPNKACELEFDVTIQGLEDSTVPTVRFVLGGSQGFECSFPCTTNDDKWIAKMPPMPFLKDNSVKFRVEVIVDGYYFEPAIGVVYLVSDPSVKFQPSVSKPTVTTSFTVKQESEPNKKAEEDEQLSPQYSSDPSPNQKSDDVELTHTNGQKTLSPKNDEHIDHTRIEDISSYVIPGESTDPEPQHGNNPTEGDEEGFDAKRIADSIIQSTLGRSQKPNVPGTLFPRDGAGKPIVNGLDTPASKQTKADNAKKVRDILKN